MSNFEGWVDLDEELSTRMFDVVNAVAHGHDGLFLMAEAAHIIADVEKLFAEKAMPELDTPGIKEYDE